MAQKDLKITPLQDRVLVEPLNKEGEEKTKGGIIIPETASKEKPQEGKVVAVGAGRFDDGELVKPTVKVGDRVIFSKYGYDEIKIDDIEYYILKEENILAILK